MYVVENCEESLQIRFLGLIVHKITGKIEKNVFLPIFGVKSGEFVVVWFLDKSSAWN